MRNPPLRAATAWVTLETIAALSVCIAALAACSTDSGVPDPTQNGSGGAGGGDSHSGGGGYPPGLLTSVVFGQSSGPINEGFIGGPCESNDDCPYRGGFCLTEAEGFPGGMCSLDCSGYCPDQTDMVTTFCPNPEALGTSAEAGLCTTRCDYGQSPSGCRTGYQCQQQARYGEPGSQVFACVPGSDNPHQLSDCEQQLLAHNVAFSPAINPKSSPEGFPNLICDIDTPVWLAPQLGGVTFRPGGPNQPPATIFTACPHAVAMLDSAEVLATQGVSDVVHYGVYNCRVISGTANLSEHAFANAIDIAGVQLEAEGPYYSVLANWEKDEPNPTTPGGMLLHSFVHTVFDADIYNIILTPDYNAAHADHFHCDLTAGSNFLE